MNPQLLIEKYRDARKENEYVVLEGFHAIKHALRFEATVDSIISCDPRLLGNLIASHAPDLKEYIDEHITYVEERLFTKLSPYPPQTHIIGIAKRPQYDSDNILTEKRERPLVALDHPSDPANVGSVIRVAAGAGAHAVCVVGDIDPWRPNVVRGAQGLQFALPVIQAPNIKAIQSPIVVFDERGENMYETDIPNNATFVFGSERSGVSDETKAKADFIVRIPMQKLVSSINLATSVGISLYHLNR